MEHDVDAIEVVPTGSPEDQPRGVSVVDRPPLEIDETPVERPGGDLMADAGLELSYSTDSAAEFFNRSNQWLYWGLREKVFTYEDGTTIEPIRIGPDQRRRFTLAVIKEIMKCCYRRGNFSKNDVEIIMTRIKLAEKGVEWREVEGWRYAKTGRSTWRWVPPDEAVRDQFSGEWEWVGKIKQRRGKKPRQ